MNTVEPIRDIQKINEIKHLLSEKSKRDEFLFLFGVHTGLRISDILKLKVSDVRDKTHVTIREKKTSKAKRFKLSNELIDLITDFTNNMYDDEYLFRSREGENKPITRFMAYKVLNNASKAVGLTQIGTHTLRKTFGYHFYQKTKNIALLQIIFNHSSPKTTLRYIGIDQDHIDDAMSDFVICDF